MKPFFAVLLLCAGLATAAPVTESYTNAYDAIALFTRVLEEVRKGYVDIEATGYDDLIRNALTGMLEHLDPYSQFLDEEGYEGLMDETSGHFGGVGLVISMKDGMLTVIAPMEDTPAFRAGILPGDIILKIDDEETRELNLAEAVKRMRGAPGTEVTLTTLTPSTRETAEHRITREDIKVDSVKDAKMLEAGIGYVRLTQFSEPTGEALKEALKDLTEEQDLRALILDLRGNPGGLLTSAAEVAELFLPKGALIVFTKDRSGEAQLTYKSGGRTHYTDFPIAVLVNGGSASASEIVAGALQDHGRAILVGEKTFGKGSVQSILPLDDGSAVKLTTAKYYTPGERVIHEKGIEPDIAVEMNPEHLYLIRLRQAQENGNGGEQPADEPELRDLQLEKAVGVLQGVLIFKEKQ
jgi:carboxyl-terminal processing protease